MPIYSDPDAVAEAERLHVNTEKRPWTVLERKHLVEMWNAGFKPFEIGEELGRSAGAVIAEATRLRHSGEWCVMWRNPAGRVRE